MTVVLGLAAAICYGTSDFVGGLASRLTSARAGTGITSALRVLLHSYPVGAVLIALLLPAFPGELTVRALAFGIAGGIAGLIGVVVMYGLMVSAPMNVISPVTAVLAAIVPVVFAVLVGERPHATAWAGIVLGVFAVVLVSRTGEDHPHGPIGIRVLALAGLAGLGFGLYFIFLARAGSDSGLWALLISRIASAVLVAPLAWRRGAFAPLRGRVLASALAAGAFDAAANLFFLLAARRGLLSLASVLTSLYPAVTVMLAVGVLHEHTNKVQRGGLALAAASVVLITV